MFPDSLLMLRRSWMLVCLLALPFPILKGQPSDESRVYPLPHGSSTWSSGFWAQRWSSLKQDMIPSMWELMKGDTYKPFYQHFLIAAGLQEGQYHGAQWNDGDFYKWMEAVCLMMAVEPDKKWDTQLDTIIETIALAQSPDGYLHTPTLIKQRQGDTQAKPFQDRFNFEMYNMGHLMTTACVHHQVTGKRTLLDVALKSAGFLEKAFENPTPELARNAVCPSHYMGLMDLFRETGQQRWLDLASHLIAMRDLVEEGGDDNQDRQPLREHEEIHGHAVRANYLYAGVTDLFLESGDASLWTPLEATWKNLMEKKVYLTGGCGALYDGAAPYGSARQTQITRVHQAYGRNYQLPNLTAHNETCANIGSMLWQWKLFQATGEARFIDALERTLYNSLLSGVDLQGKHFFYVNPLQHLDPPPVDLRWSRERVRFVTSFCCPPNLLRILAHTPSYAYAVSDQTLWVNLYGSGNLQADCPNVGPVNLTQETLYPWNGSITLKIESCPQKPFDLALRIPAWTPSAQLTLNGKPLENLWCEPGQFLHLRRDWRPEDQIKLDLEMPAQLIESHPLVEENRSQVALQRGPLVYCLEGIDLPKNTAMTAVAIEEDFQPRIHHRPNLLDDVHVIEGRVRIQEPGDWDGKLYRPYQKPRSTTQRVAFIPYYAWANRRPSEMTVWLPLAH
jgi:DUF1680 family protein